MNPIIIRIVLYSVVAIFIGVVWFGFEVVPGNGGKKGLRLLLAPLFLTWIGIAMAGWLKCGGADSSISVIPFVVAAIVVVVCLLWLMTLIVSNKVIRKP